MFLHNNILFIFFCKRLCTRKQGAVDGVHIRLDAGSDDIRGNALPQIFLLAVGDPNTNLTQRIRAAGQRLDGVVDQLEFLAYDAVDGVEAGVDGPLPCCPSE